MGSRRQLSRKYRNSALDYTPGTHQVKVPGKGLEETYYPEQYYDQNDQHHEAYDPANVSPHAYYLSLTVRCPYAHKSFNKSFKVE